MPPVVSAAEPTFARVIAPATPVVPERKLTLSVVMPVYNERYLVEAAVTRVLSFQSSLVSELQLILVDDGSTDGTAQILERLAATHPETIVYLRHGANRGKGAALRTGIAHATCDLTVIQDADLEYDPQDWHRLIPLFVEAGADAVYGSRFLNGHYRRVLYFWHEVGNRLLTTFSNVMTGLNHTDIETCCKMIRTEFLRSIPLRSNDFSIEVELTAKLAKRGAVLYEVPISYRGRTYREGKKINWRHGLTALASILRWRLLDDLFRDDEYGAEILTRMAHVHRFNRWMATVLDPWVGERVLEIGAGIGSLTIEFLPRSRYVATDVNAHYLAYLRNLATGRPYLSVAELDLADQSSFDRLEESFDTAICLNVLEHIPQEAASLRHLLGVLEPGGRALILVPQGPSLYNTLDKALGHVKRYDRDELRKALEHAGFEVEALFPFNRLGLPGWILNGTFLRRRSFSRIQLKILNTLIPLLWRLDEFLPWPALSLIAVGRRPHSSATG